MDVELEIEQELQVVRKMFEDFSITREQLLKIQHAIFNQTAMATPKVKNIPNRSASNKSTRSGRGIGDRSENLIRVTRVSLTI